MNNLQPYNPSFPMNQDPLGINSSMDTTPFGNPSGQMAEHRYVQNQAGSTLVVRKLFKLDPDQYKTDQCRQW